MALKSLAVSDIPSPTVDAPSTSEEPENSVMDLSSDQVSEAGMGGAKVGDIFTATVKMKVSRVPDPSDLNSGGIGVELVNISDAKPAKEEDEPDNPAEARIFSPKPSNKPVSPKDAGFGDEEE